MVCQTLHVKYWKTSFIRNLIKWTYIYVDPHLNSLKIIINLYLKPPKKYMRTFTFCLEDVFLRLLPSV